MKYVTWQDRKQVVADLKPVYSAATADEAERELGRIRRKVEEEISRGEPAVARAVELVIPFTAFPTEVRKIVYTTNAVESLHMSLRKVTKTRGSFPTEEAAFKLLYLALARVVTKWQTVQSWKQMLNYLDTMCGDRIRDAGGLR